MSALVVRRIRAISLGDVAPGGADMPEPRFERADPRELLVDGAYQRELSTRSVRLILKIVANWNWRNFKPPIVVEIDGGLHVIDGQHTAIAAASHPAIKTIPVMIVVAEEQIERAKAFMGHNRDRVNITSTQLFHAAVAAADPDAVTVAQICERAGARVLKNAPPNGAYDVGDTVAVTSLNVMANRLGALKARQVLQALVEAKVAPISADLIKAASELVAAPEYANEITLEQISNAVRMLGPRAETEARQLAAAKWMPRWRALAVVIFRNKGRGSRKAA
ncbi:DUF6551 family protein [Methylopila sp. M107]|uniref:DUF6551 family protein n=1 Tax=Methylopila sp. M107 TaxID=1101190 RepID=UPI00036FEBBD|nr:DUF6551 family protein [Methylopila sp. M107]